MAKKLPSKKKVTPKNHEEAHVDMIVEKREYDGSKTVVKEKGAVQENENNPIGTLPEGKHGELMKETYLDVSLIYKLK